MVSLSAPSKDNNFYADHIEILSRNLKRWSGQKLVEPELMGYELGRYVFSASFALVSHNVDNDPVFNYANRTALELFEMDWKQFTALPSRLSAEPVDQKKRAELLSKVSQNGYFSGYQGVRISRTNRRFLIKNATIWNLLDEHEQYYGQAALFKNWIHIPDSNSENVSK